jgi:hypothetical protein
VAVRVAVAVSGVGRGLNGRDCGLNGGDCGRSGGSGRRGGCRRSDGVAGLRVAGGKRRHRVLHVAPGVSAGMRVAEGLRRDRHRCGPRCGRRCGRDHPRRRRRRGRGCRGRGRRGGRRWCVCGKGPGSRGSRGHSGHLDRLCDLDGRVDDRRRRLRGAGEKAPRRRRGSGDHDGQRGDEIAARRALQAERLDVPAAWRGGTRERGGARHGHDEQRPCNQPFDPPHALTPRCRHITRMRYRQMRREA